MFHLFEHTADVGLHAEADSLEELYGEAARGLLSILVARPEAVAGSQQRELEIAGDAPELLLFDLLSELVYLYDTEQFLCARCAATRTETGLTVTCHGERADAERHRLEHEIKAVTYHRLACFCDNERWHCDVIFDI